jgi:peptidase E
LTAVDKNNINILIIPFARDPSLWAAKCLEVKNKFDEVGDMRKITIHIATNSVEGLINQIFKADILFIW